ncbi:Pre-mRNA-splicing factor ISY1 [Vanrija pseudolonga]|uniref:Pre-mRNA-splicing factor ISY1 n=1 Tax=Vanrija pseudolonga TaxID=143232 RepID=A0AAF1BMI1_9TREE|nr:Pre-mRNA-splicing factor ISY1 [Vanrija pseudolonga]
MARNSEKAQSMLYRFREQQAVEMGLGNRVRGERRPRMASSVSSLRECERWRGDIMKEISRKVSKIQDSSLTDYEIRDLNDEINQLMREKRHWETQIVNLGGANYKRAQAAMVDDEGREVPGTRGYKYFGRARDLPGVKEMFAKGAQAATEESARNASFQMFRNQGPDYYGDNDELDPKLAAEEDEATRQDWEQAAREAAEILALSDDAVVPFPEPSKPAAPAAGEASTKRKSPEPEAAAEEPAAEDTSKKSKKGGKGGRGKKGAAPPPPPPGAPAATGGNDAAAAAAQAAQAALAASFMSVFDAATLSAPTPLSTDELGKILLERRKQALREEYGV